MEEQSRTLSAMTPKVLRAWYVACPSGELVADKPLVKRIHGRPILLFRGADGRAAALLDRCPHRNVPISCGGVKDGRAWCGYHGWEFEPDGSCTTVPGLDADANGGATGLAARRAMAFPVREQQGFVWVWTDLAHAPDTEPFHFAHADDPDYLTVRRALTTKGSVHMVIENALDVPHTAFLHGGLFRTNTKRRPIRCVVRRFADKVECQYIGEQRPSGLVARLLAPGGGELEHYDRFHLPSISEVEYRLGTDSHLLLRGACTPIDDFETVLYAVVSIKTPLPRMLVRPIIEPIALKIFGQDQWILDKQTDTLKSFGEAKFASTDLDVLGMHILRLMTRAARGEAGDPSADPVEREVTMWV